jgi:phosphatidate cytidylyltransferase
MQRIVPGLFIAGLWLLLLLKGTILLFCFVVLGVVLFGADEYLTMTDNRPLPELERWLLNLVTGSPVFLVCLFPAVATLPVALLSAFGCLVGYCFFRYRVLTDPFPLFCRHSFGVLYIGLLASHIVLLRYLPQGAAWLIIASAITACSDTGAYFVGRSKGKRKLCPNISPNKTVEGAIGGVIAGTLAAAVAAAMLLDQVNWLYLVVASLLLSLVGIAGDLTESIIKRGTGSKDSGRCLGGHGGILDRVDSLLFVSPVLYYLLQLPGW